MSLRDAAIRNYRYVSDSMPVRDFVQTIAVPEQRQYPVTDAAGKVVGLFDVESLRSMTLEDEGRPVRDFATSRLDVIDADAKVSDALSFLLSRDFVLVTEGGHIIGYVTPGHLFDVARYQSIRRRAGL